MNAKLLKNTLLLLLLLFATDYLVLLVLKPSEYMEVSYEPSIGLHLKPNQNGFFKSWPAGEIHGLFQVNSNGWNSVHSAYDRFRKPGYGRIVIIGDSYVEGRHVNIQDTYPAQLERLLKLKGNLEVYPFAVSGWQAAQYLYVLPTLIERYKPDQVIINMERDDFKDAGSCQNTNFGMAAFNHQGDSIRLDPPSFYQTAFYKKALATSAIVRYLYAYKNRKAYHTGSLNVALTNAEKKFALYFYKQLSLVQKKSNTPIWVVLDGDRTLFDNKIVTSKGINLYNNHLKKLGEQQGVKTIALDSYLIRDFKKNKERFNFSQNYHWNAYTHKLVANTVLENFLKN